MMLIEYLIRNPLEINKELEKIDSGIDYKNKYILWLENRFYFKYLSNYLKGELRVLKADGSEIPLKLKISKPFPNKNYSLISRKEGRKTMHGIPLVFDTFEELQEIKKICIDWKLSYDTEIKQPSHDTEVKKYVETRIFYNLEFKKDEKSKFYYLSTIDYNYETLEEEEKIKEYFEKFDDFLHIDFYEDKVEWKQYKGEEIEESTIEKIIMEVNLQSIFQNIEIEKEIVRADIFRKSLLLEPVKWEER